MKKFLTLSLAFICASTISVYGVNHTPLSKGLVYYEVISKKITDAISNCKQQIEKDINNKELELDLKTLLEIQEIHLKKLNLDLQVAQVSKGIHNIPLKYLTIINVVLFASTVGTCLKKFGGLLEIFKLILFPLGIAGNIGLFSINDWYTLNGYHEYLIKKYTEKQ